MQWQPISRLLIGLHHRHRLLILLWAASDTFVGIRLIDATAFIIAQLLGALTATILFRWLIPLSAKDLIVERQVS